MSYSNTHRLLVVLVSLAVVCSFVGAPVAAAAATSGDGLSETVSFSDDSGASDTDDDGDDSDSDDSDADDSDSDDSDTEESDSGDRTIFDDGEEADSEESDDEDSEETEDGSSDDSESDSDTSDSDDSDSDTSDSDDSDSDTSDDSEVRDRINGSVDDIYQAVNGTVSDDDSLEETDETVDAITETAEETTEETTESTELDTSTLTTSLEALLSHSQQVVSADVFESTGTATDVSETTSMSLVERNIFGAADGESAGADEASDDSSESGPMMAVGSGSGGQPVPSGPVGGAAAGIGIAAAAAVMRGSPLLAGVGASSSTGTGGSSLLGSLLGKIRPFIFPLRYSRYDDSDPLEHEAREQVYEIVNETPGSYLSEVSKEADLPLSTTRHHIKVLEREDLVSGAKLRGKRRFYPAYAEGVELAAALNDESTASIIDAISRIGAASVSDLAEELDRDPSTISHHLQRLEEDAIITRERDGRAVVNKLSSEARTALEPETTPKPGQAGSAIAGGAD